MGDNPMFSVITPTWNRLDGRLERCLKSVDAQTWCDFEHVVVDDGSTDGTDAFISLQAVSPWRQLKPIIKDHEGRVIARNAGMKAARGEWICWLDSDDAWDPMYLETFAHFIERRPDVDLWVTGAVVHGVRSGGPTDRYGGQTVPYWTKLRQAWVPPLAKEGSGQVHALFNSGRVGTGMFVFRKRCLEATGYLPEWRNHNQIADGIDEYLGFEPGTTGYGTVGPQGGRPRGLVGNPWGDDHAMFQALCLHFEAQVLGEAGGKGNCLYVHYVR